MVTGGGREPAEARVRRLVAWPVGGLIALLGLVFAGGGFYLASLGGSAYYLLAGLGLLATAFFLFRRDARALRLYALILVGTTAWGIAEVGFAGWQLVPRLVAPFLLAILFVPWLLKRQAGGRLPWTVPGFLLGLVLAVGLGAVIHAMGPADIADPLFDRGIAALPASRIQSQSVPAVSGAGEWLSYGNDTGGSRFSPLTQITPANAGQLQPVWTFHIGIGSAGKTGGLEVTPLKVGGNLYVCNGSSDVIAIDAETGKQVWRFKANVDATGVQIGACRGVTYYRAPGLTGPCAGRIISPTLDARLVALDAETGKPCEDFGTHGRVSLLGGMGHVIKGYYFATSAPAVIRGKVVLGGWVSDGQYWGEPPGVVRAFDAVTGRFAWAFDPGRPNDHSEPKGARTYTVATPNSWAPMSSDEALGLVYIPTGNATPDYYGAQRRPFDDRFSSSVIALDGETGAMRWTFQTTHHDLWDYDVPAQASLVDLPTSTGIVKALVQPTKRGEVFVLDRVTGKPLADVAEVKVPTKGAAPGERISPTQPFSVGMPSFRGPDLREKDMWGVSPIDQLFCRILFKRARYEGPLTPPGLTPAVIYPGFLGGTDWGGVSIDRDRNLMIINSNRVPVYAQLITRAEADKRGIRIATQGVRSDAPGGQAQAYTPYAGIILPFLSPTLSPCNEPPYGFITAVDLVTGKVVWHHPIGTARDSGPFGIASHLPILMGLPNTGGSIVTRGGVVFIAATQEKRIRALDVKTGRELWSAPLPAGGHATPASYWSDKSKRQFVVQAAGGNVTLISGVSDAIIAYALPSGSKTAH
jgi:quinoprotein glucose dehydrogenase